MAKPERQQRRGPGGAAAATAAAITAKAAEAARTTTTTTAAAAAARTTTTHCVPEDDPNVAELRELRARWELASVLHFLDLFAKQLSLKKDNGLDLGMTAGELEDALLHPSERDNARILTHLHVSMLKGLYARRNNKALAELAEGRWAPVLAAKVCERRGQVCLCTHTHEFICVFHLRLLDWKRETRAQYK